MLSPSKKVEWRCPKCGSADIVTSKIYPMSFYDSGEVLRYHRRKSGHCLGCLTWWSWAMRAKESVQRGKKGN